jgi:hypothetical protein
MVLSFTVLLCVKQAYSLMVATSKRSVCNLHVPVGSWRFGHVSVKSWPLEHVHYFGDKHRHAPCVTGMHA